jgi:16S rRNA (cytidine1402-2'-O)-methyltransferase
MPKNVGTLYVVAVPIGNPQDITLRGLDVLRSVSAVVCEERREGSTLLKRLGVENDLLVLNEHNEAGQASLVLARLAQGESLALISDHGTPVFADPGYLLVELVSSGGIPVVPVPGASSLMAALSLVSFKLDRFVFYGFLPREEAARRAELTRLKGLGMAVVLMDTPYRLTSLLQDAIKVFGAGQGALLACDITMPSERIYRGTLQQILTQAQGKKAEFVLVLEPPRRK